MKSLLKKIISAILILVLFISCIPMDIAHAAEKKQVKYVALGDSLTDYATYYGKSWTSYPVYVEKKLEAAKNVDLIVSNHAVGGYTTDDVINQLQNNQTVIADVKNADYVTVYIGGNDLIQAVLSALTENGFTLNDLYNFTSLFDTNSTIYKTITDVLKNPSNKYHKQYITSINGKIKNIASLIQQYNATCKIGISTIGSSITSSDIKMISDALNCDSQAVSSIAKSMQITLTEMELYFTSLAFSNKNIFYINTDDVMSYKYYQYDENGNFLDFHPNYEGQQLIADCFIKDFWNKFNLDSTEDNNNEISADNKYYCFFPINSCTYSAKNAQLGEVNKMSITANGIGAKANCTRTTDAREFTLSMKPCKASGVITGLSFWDNSNATEVLLRFEGTNTTKIAVCVGGNGKYISKYMYLGFDASSKEHTYNVKFDSKNVTVLADNKKIGSLDISNITSPVSNVTPVIFIEKADWVGKFGNTQNTSYFSYIK